jgi:hypothetical protein
MLRTVDPATTPPSSVLEFVNSPPGPLAQINRWFGPALLSAIGAAVAAIPLILASLGRFGPPLLVLEVFGLPAIAGGLWQLIETARGAHRRIRIDFAARTVTFENFRQERPWRFPSRPVRLFECRFDEIRGVELVRRNRGSNFLSIVLPRFRVRITEDTTNFSLLEAVITRLDRENHGPQSRVPLAHSERLFRLIGLIGGLATIAAVLIAWSLGWWEPVLDWLERK